MEQGDGVDEEVNAFLGGETAGVEDGVGLAHRGAGCPGTVGLVGSGIVGEEVGDAEGAAVVEAVAPAEVVEHALGGADDDIGGAAEFGLGGGGLGGEGGGGALLPGDEAGPGVAATGDEADAVAGVAEAGGDGDGQVAAPHLVGFDDDGDGVGRGWRLSVGGMEGAQSAPPRRGEEEFADALGDGRGEGGSVEAFVVGDDGDGAGGGEGFGDVVVGGAALGDEDDLAVSGAEPVVERPLAVEDAAGGPGVEPDRGAECDDEGVGDGGGLDGCGRIAVGPWQGVEHIGVHLVKVGDWMVRSVPNVVPVCPGVGVAARRGRGRGRGRGWGKSWGWIPKEGSPHEREESACSRW